MDVDQVLDGSVVTVRTGTYDVVRATRPIPGAVATIDDGRELTVVIEEGGYDARDALAVESEWKLLTFELDLPFDLVGFLARVATALADAEVSIFALSAYSTDHVLVKARDLETARDRLETLGCTVRDEDAP